MPPKKKSKRSRSVTSWDDRSENSSNRINGVHAVPIPNPKNTKDQHSDGSGVAKEVAANNQTTRIDPSKKQKSKNESNTTKRKTCKGDTSPNRKKRKHKSQAGGVTSTQQSYDETNTEAGSSSDEDGESSNIEYSHPPAIGDEIAIKCPAEPPFPEGWYAAVVLDIIHHGSDFSNDKTASGAKSKGKEGFTVQVEWDGGGVEEVNNPNWRMKGDEPDKQGRRSHRDAKLRPYFRYWVKRLDSMSESEKKLRQSRTGRSTRIDPNQQVEWIQCANPSCGKWRPLPTYLKSSSVLESCSHTWYCVLNSWDEATASCGAPQETGYMPPAK